jgi:hypothetical protein
VKIARHMMFVDCSRAQREWISRPARSPRLERAVRWYEANGTSLKPRQAQQPAPPPRFFILVIGRLTSAAAGLQTGALTCSAALCPASTCSGGFQPPFGIVNAHPRHLAVEAEFAPGES